MPAVRACFCEGLPSGCCGEHGCEKGCCEKDCCGEKGCCEATGGRPLPADTPDAEVLRPACVRKAALVITLIEWDNGMDITYGKHIVRLMLIY